MAATRRRRPGGEGGGADGEARASASRARRLAASGETQLSRTDEDARLLAKSGQRVAGYNVQIAVDDAAQADRGERSGQRRRRTGQLYAMAAAAKEALGAETLQAMADVGYFNERSSWRAKQTASSLMCRNPSAAPVSPHRAASRAKPRLRRRDRHLSLPGGQTAAADEKAAAKRRPDRGPLCEPQAGLRRLLRGRCVTGKRQSGHPALGARCLERHRQRMQKAGALMRRQRRPRRASLRHAQMPRRLPPLPGARLDKVRGE